MISQKMHVFYKSCVRRLERLGIRQFGAFPGVNSWLSGGALMGGWSIAL